MSSSCLSVINNAYAGLQRKREREAVRNASVQCGERKAVGSVTAKACVRGEAASVRELSTAKERPTMHWNRGWVPKGEDPTQLCFQHVNEACRDFCSRKQVNESAGAGVILEGQGSSQAGL